MHRLVAGRADGVADHAVVAGIALDLLDAGLRRVERQIEQALEPVVLGQDALDQPFVVGAAERGLELVLRMHAEREHRGRKHDLVVEAERVHGAARQLDEAVRAAFLDRLEQALLMRHAAIEMLVQDAGLVIEQRMVLVAGPRRIGRAHLADHVVVDQRQDFRPERGLRDMRVHVDQEIILVVFGLPRGMREDVARVRLHGDFGQFAELLRRSLEHRASPLIPRRAASAGACPRRAASYKRPAIRPCRR